jgi:hypothetical protein
VALKTVVVLSDLRSVPLMAALNIVRSVKDTDEVILTASEQLFYYNEYADYTPKIWKLFLLAVLRLFFSLKLVRKNANTELDETETLGLTSSFYSITDDSGATENKYPKIFSSLYALTLGSKEVTKFLDSIGDINFIYVFNGRTASSYLISKYAHTKNIKIGYYEYSRDSNGYRLLPVAPHASGDVGAIQWLFWKNCCISNADKNKLSQLYFEKKLNSSFTQANTIKCEKKYDISIYLGSDHEYQAVDSEICNIEWRGNIEFIKQVIAKYGINKSYAIRCHPNQENDKNWKSLISAIDLFIIESNVKIDMYDPISGVSSYDLMANSKVIATDLSTIAVDAVILGYKVDIFGNIELKRFLKELDLDGIFNATLKTKCISELLAFYEMLFVIRFNRTEKHICQLYFIIDHGFKKIMKLSIYEK